MNIPDLSKYESRKQKTIYACMPLSWVNHQRNLRLPLSLFLLSCYLDAHVHVKREEEKEEEEGLAFFASSI